jgi:hypothetical protein
MKATGMEDNSEAKPLAQIEGHSYSEVGWISRTKIFSASGRGRTFFLTFLFIELIDTAANPCGVFFVFGVLCATFSPTAMSVHFVNRFTPARIHLLALPVVGGSRVWSTCGAVFFHRATFAT